MALEIALFGIVLVLGILSYTFGLFSSHRWVMVLGCALLIGSGALLWGSGGLLLEHQVTGFSSGVVHYTDLTIPMTNVGLSMVALVLIAIGILSIMAVSFGENISSRQARTYHY